MRRSARTDLNHQTIVATLRQSGCLVQSLAAVGKGVPDLLVSRQGQLYLLEVKDGAKPPSERRLTPDQQDWHDQWWMCATSGRLNIVTSAAEALTAVGIKVSK